MEGGADVCYRKRPFSRRAVNGRKAVKVYQGSSVCYWSSEEIFRIPSVSSSHFSTLIVRRFNEAKWMCGLGELLCFLWNMSTFRVINFSKHLCDTPPSTSKRFCFLPCRKHSKLVRLFYHWFVMKSYVEYIVFLQKLRKTCDALLIRNQYW